MSKYRQISKENILEVLSFQKKPIMESSLQNFFYVTKPSHERRIASLIDSLVDEGKVSVRSGPSAAVQVIGSILASIGGAKLTERYVALA